MLPYTTRKKIRYTVLLIPTLLLSISTIGKLEGVSSEDQYYFTPTTPSTTTDKIQNDYAPQDVYLIDLNRIDFTPTMIHIFKNEVLFRAEELAEEERQLIYEIDIKRKPERK